MNGRCIECNKDYGDISTESVLSIKKTNTDCCDQKEYKPSWNEHWIIPIVVESDDKEPPLSTGILQMDVDVETAKTISTLVLSVRYM